MYGKNVCFLPQKGYLPDSRHFLYIEKRGSTIVRSQIFSISMDKSPHPCAFFKSRERISDETFDVSIPMLNKILSHVGVNAEIELSLGSSEHCFAKNSLKTIHFCLVISYENAIF